jgi:outer membrane receptor protein involved in Fe transport
VQYHHTLRSSGALTYGVAFKRSRIRDTNDPVNDFAYGEALNLASGGSSTDCASGVVSACGYSLFSDRTARDVILNLDAVNPSAHHAVRYGAAYDTTNVGKDYAVTLQPQNFISAAPATVVDNAPNVAHTESAYLQDTWQMGPLWRADYGLRLDAFQVFSDQFDRGFSQTSPRLKITRIYGPRASVYVYAGRFFTPFSFENVSPTAAQQLNAPLQPAIAQFDLRPQRDTDVEIGGSARLGPGELGIRIMQKVAVDLIDDTQVGVTALHQDINYARGNISSQSASYQQVLARGGRAFLSLTHTRAVNKGCETQLLAPCFGAPDDWTPADHDQRWDAAGGVTSNDARGGWLSVTGEYGSGLSSGFCEPADDNCKVPPHTTFDLEKGIATGNGMAITIGVRNIFNDRYRITYLNAQGNHYDAGRTFSLGLRFGATR